MVSSPVNSASANNRKTEQEEFQNISLQIIENRTGRISTHYSGVNIRKKEQEEFLIHYSVNIRKTEQEEFSYKRRTGSIHL
jgi:hypothetical protein